MRTNDWYECTARKASSQGKQALMKAAVIAQFAAQPFEIYIDGVIRHLNDALTEINRIVQNAINDGDDPYASATHVAEQIIQTVTWAVANTQIGYLVTSAAKLDEAARQVEKECLSDEFDKS